MRDNLPGAIAALDWECKGADTRYLTHAIHRYSGKFIPQIARQAIALLTDPGEMVLDPYCGSGTTLLECALTGRRSIGIDLNPLAVLISTVKVTPIANEALRTFVPAFGNSTAPLQRGPRNLRLFARPLVDPEELDARIRQDPRWTDAWYRKWYQDNVLRELIVLNQRIMSEPDRKCRNLGLVAFSDVLRKSSNANSSYPNVMFDRRRKDRPPVTPQFLSKLEQVAGAVAQLAPELDHMPIPAVLLGDSRSFPVEDLSVDAIITHPPYIGSIPYAEYGVLSLTWLGHDPRTLDVRLTGGRRQTKDVVDRFRAGLEDMLREAWRVLKRQRILFMQLGCPTVRRKRIDLPAMSLEIASSIGFQLVATQRRMGTNRRSNQMGHETLLFLRKA